MPKDIVPYQEAWNFSPYAKYGKALNELTSIVQEGDVHSLDAAVQEVRARARNAGILETRLDEELNAALSARETSGYRERPMLAAGTEIVPLPPTEKQALTSTQKQEAIEPRYKPSHTNGRIIAQLALSMLPAGIQQTIQERYYGNQYGFFSSGAGSIVIECAVGVLATFIGTFAPMEYTTPILLGGFAVMGDAVARTCVSIYRGMELQRVTGQRPSQGSFCFSGSTPLEVVYGFCKRLVTPLEEKLKLPPPKSELIEGEEATPRIETTETKMLTADAGTQDPESEYLEIVIEPAK